MSKTIKDLKDIRDLRWIIESEEYLMQNVNPFQWAKRVYELHIHEAKLEYQERQFGHLPYKSLQEIRMANDRGVV